MKSKQLRRMPAERSFEKVMKCQVIDVENFCFNWKKILHMSEQFVKRFIWQQEWVDHLGLQIILYSSLRSVKLAFSRF